MDNTPYKIYCEDNKETFKRLDDNLVDGIITSPPYNIAVERTDCYYDVGYKDDLSESEYIEIRTSEFKEFDRILKERGVICYNISYSHNAPSLPLKVVVEVENQTDLQLVDQITWKKNTAIPFQTSPRRLSRICEQIYVFAHQDVDYKTNKKVSKVNNETGQLFYKNYLNYIEARNNDGIETELKAPFSVELVENLLDTYYPENSLVYDPFMGIGTTGVASVKNKRRFIGSEIDSRFFETAEERIKNTEVVETKKFFDFNLKANG